MPYAYHWLSQTQKTQIRHIFVVHVEDSTTEKLQPHLSPNVLLEYEKGPTTVIQFVQNHQDTTSGDDYVTVFCEDFREILKNLHHPLPLLYVRNRGFEMENTKILGNFRKIHGIFNRISQCLMEISQEKVEKLKIENLKLESFDMEKWMTILGLLCPASLESLSLDLEDFGMESIEIRRILEMTEMGIGKPLKIHFSLMELSMENLETIRLMLSFPATFRKIIITYNSIFDQNIYLEHIFGGVPFSHEITKEGKHQISFKLRNPEINSFCARKAEELSISSAHIKNAQRVLGNPLIMKTVAEELMCFDILSLRKVCRTIRYCIDYIKPNPRIKKITFNIKLDAISICPSLDDDDFLELNYEDVEDPNVPVYCHCETCGGTKLLEKEAPQRRNCGCVDEVPLIYEDFQDVVLREFALFMMYQKQPLEELNINVLSKESENLEKIRKIYTEFMDKLEQKLMIMKEIPVKKLLLSIQNHDSLMKVLPYIDSKYLKSIDIRKMFADEEDSFLEMNEILRFESHWNNLEELLIKNFVLQKSITVLGLKRFRVVDITVASISTQGLVDLKEKLVNSETFQKLKIAFKHSTIDGTLHHQMPPYRIFGDVRSVWYFRMSNPESFLHIVLHNQKQVILAKIGRKDLPEGVFENIVAQN